MQENPFIEPFAERLIALNNTAASNLLCLIACMVQASRERVLYVAQ